jgi:hypothetical protein
VGWQIDFEMSNGNRVSTNCGESKSYGGDFEENPIMGRRKRGEGWGRCSPVYVGGLIGTGGQG